MFSIIHKYSSLHCDETKDVNMMFNDESHTGGLTTNSSVETWNQVGIESNEQMALVRTLAVWIYRFNRCRRLLWRSASLIMVHGLIAWKLYYSLLLGSQFFTSTNSAVTLNEVMYMNRWRLYRRMIVQSYWHLTAVIQL